MAFGARNENGAWRLCLRKGKTITHVNAERFKSIEIRFSSQAKAKACADKLNELFWATYRKYDTKSTEPYLQYWEMLDVIAQHGGLTALQIQEMRHVR